MNKKVLLKTLSYINKLNPKSIIVGSVASYFNGVKSINNIKDIDICLESIEGLENLPNTQYLFSPTNMFSKRIVTSIYDGVSIDIFLTPIPFNKTIYLKEYNIRILSLSSQIEHYTKMVEIGKLKNKFKTLLEIHKKALNT